MKKKVLISILAFIITFSLLLTGCDEHLESVSSVKAQTKKCFPESEIISIEENNNKITYTIRNKGFEFQFTNTVSSNPIFGVDEAFYECDYLAQVLNTDEVLSFMSENGFMFQHTHDTAELDVRMVNYSELEDVYRDIEAFENLVYDYLPEEQFYEDEIEVYVYIGYKLLATESINHKTHTKWNKRMNKLIKENDIKKSEYQP